MRRLNPSSPCDLQLRARACCCATSYLICETLPWILLCVPRRLDGALVATEACRLFWLLFCFDHEDAPCRTRPRRCDGERAGAAAADRAPRRAHARRCRRTAG